jgi:predicted phage tail component-like protein
MNYIILNGTKSTIVQGLLIQELPPISKPQIRSNIETIDGRDGDIITRLGYSAYDKILTIGIKKDADINDVIAYFVNRDSGEITFSNEPDFYYRFNLLEAINFERLIRFKQANVNFHVQPFKYSLSESDTEYPVKNNSELHINNNGNIFSKPSFTLTGSNTCGVYLNGSQIFSITLNPNESITIDTEIMEAFYGSVLKNRKVVGDYTKFYMPIGDNVIKLTGSVTKFTIKNYSRWI